MRDQSIIRKYNCTVNGADKMENSRYVYLIKGLSVFVSVEQDVGSTVIRSQVVLFECPIGIWQAL